MNYVPWKEGRHVQNPTRTQAFSALQLVPGIAAAVEAPDGVEAALVAGAGLLAFVNIC